MARAATPTKTVEAVYEEDPTAADLPLAPAPELVFVLLLVVEVCSP